MSLFGRSGMTREDAKVVAEVLKDMAKEVAARFRENESQIEELKAEIERLKREPRKTVAQRARERGAA